MRKLLIVASLLVVVVVGGVLLAAANLDSWLNDNRDLLGSQVQRAVGRPVRFGELDVSVWSGFGIRVSDVAVGDDPAYSDGDFVSADTVEVRVDLLPALWGDIRIGRVVLREPSIRIIQSARGLSIDSLGAGGAKTKPATPSADSGGPPPAQLLAATISLIDVKGGRLIFVDRRSTPPAELALEQIDFSASDVSLTEPIHFAFRAAALGAAEQNIEVSGTVGPMSAGPAAVAIDLELAVGPVSIANAMALPVVDAPPEWNAGGSFRIDSSIHGRLDSFSMDGAFDATDAVFAFGSSAGGEAGAIGKAAGQPLRFEWSAVRKQDVVEVPKIELQFGEARVHGEANVKGLTSSPRAALSLRSDRLDLPVSAGAPEGQIRDLSVEAELTWPHSGPRIAIELGSSGGEVAGADYQDLRAKFGFADGRATIQSLALRTFDGSVHVSGYYDLAGEVPSFDLETRMSDVSVSKLVENRAPSMAGKLDGTVGANLAVRGAGSEWEQIREVMTGGGNLTMEDGRLEDINLADSVMEKVTGVPGLSNLIDPQLRQKYPAVFGGTETEFEKLDAKIEIRDGIARVRDFRLAARDYALTGEGNYALRNELDMRAAMTFSEALTADLIDSVKEARYLKNANGRIEIPVRLRGGIPDVRAEPDLARVARALQAELLGGLLKDVLEPQSEGDAKKGDSKQGESQKTDGKELLRRGLESLFGQ